ALVRRQPGLPNRDGLQRQSLVRAQPAPRHDDVSERRPQFHRPATVAPGTSTSLVGSWTYPRTVNPSARPWVVSNATRSVIASRVLRSVYLVSAPISSNSRS